MRTVENRPDLGSILIFQADRLLSYLRGTVERMSNENTGDVPAELLKKFIRILRSNRLRTGELLEKAKVTDRKLGEAVVWTLLKRGEIAIGPDSKLRVLEATVAAH